MAKKLSANIIIQARMSSTRLAGKVLMPICGKPILSHVIDRVQRVSYKNTVIIATTTDRKDDVIEELCLKSSIISFRGSSLNVLKRYYDCCKKYPADVIVRITSDCPLIDPSIIDKGLKIYFSNKFDYVSNTLSRSYPRGMDIEIFSYQALENAFNQATTDFDKEHVTPYIYRHKEMFSLNNFSDEKDNSSYRLTVDTKEDFTLVKNIYEYLYPKKPSFDLQDILDTLKVHPDWAFINQHIKQKNS